MIGQIIGSVVGLATSVIDSKTQIKLTEAEIKKKQLTGEIDWDIEAMKGTQNSWKDEWLTVLFSIPLVMAFIPGGIVYVERGFAALEGMPEWYQYTLSIIVAASFGVRSAIGFMKARK